MIEVRCTIACIMRFDVKRLVIAFKCTVLREPLRSINDILFHVIAFPFARDTLFSEPTLVSGEFHDYDAILFLFGDVAIEWRLNVHDKTVRTKKRADGLSIH